MCDNFLYIGLNKQSFEGKIVIFDFSNLFIVSFASGDKKNCPSEAVLLSANNVLFS